MTVVRKLRIQALVAFGKKFWRELPVAVAQTGLQLTGCREAIDNPVSSLQKRLRERRQNEKNDPADYDSACDL